MIRLILIVVILRLFNASNALMYYKVERQLAAKEAYLAAKAEVNNDQRTRILEECRSIMRDVLQDAIQSTALPGQIDQDQPISPQNDITLRSIAKNKKIRTKKIAEDH